MVYGVLGSGVHVQVWHGRVVRGPGFGVYGVLGSGVQVQVWHGHVMRGPGFGVVLGSVSRCGTVRW